MSFNYLQTLDKNLVEDMIGTKVIQIRKDKLKAAEILEQKQEEWLEDYCHDITAQKFMKQGEDEWGDKSLCIHDGCYIEFNGDTYRYHWICKRQWELINNLYIIFTDDGCSYISDTKPDDDLFDNWYDVVDLDIDGWSDEE